LLDWGMRSEVRGSRRFVHILQILSESVMQVSLELIGL
jgi:hypothetical protein